MILASKLIIIVVIIIVVIVIIIVVVIIIVFCRLTCTDGQDLPTHAIQVARPTTTQINLNFDLQGQPSIAGLDVRYHLHTHGIFMRITSS